jgi:hypothetical protein
LFDLAFYKPKRESNSPNASFSNSIMFGQKSTIKEKEFLSLLSKPLQLPLNFNPKIQITTVTM